MLSRRLSNSLFSLLSTRTNSKYLNNLRVIPVAKNVQQNFTTSTSWYAKNKDKGKDKKKPANVEISPSVMEELISHEKLKQLCTNVVYNMKDEYAKNLTLRSTTGAIETISIKFEGKEYKLMELAQIVRKNPKTLILNFTSFPQAIPFVTKSLQSSGLNINPQQEGNTLYVPIPKVSKEHRESLAKNAKALYIKYRDQIKDIQNDFTKKAKNKKASEDLVRNVQKQIEKFCENFHTEIREIYNKKHNELVGSEK